MKCVGDILTEDSWELKKYASSARVTEFLSENVTLKSRARDGKMLIEPKNEAYDSNPLWIVESFRLSLLNFCSPVPP